MTNIIIPNSVTLIENRAFAYCSSLTNLIIPDSVTSFIIGEYAFFKCTNLKNIIIPSSVIFMEEGIFSYCRNLTITTPSGSFAEKYAKQNNILYKNN